MHASSTVISDHLQRLHAKVDDMAGKLDGIFKMMIFDRNASIAELTELAPTQLIPRASIVIPEGALARGASGGFGTVVRAMRDGGAVAVKLYNITQVGKVDQRDAVREALLLSQVSHHNVVSCWGMVHDPHSAQGDSLHGSLVMDWVGGGNVYDFLQDSPGTELRVRVHIALQVAAGMRHLHKHKMVHGDLKPQNVLLQLNQGEALPTVRGMEHLCWLVAAGHACMLRWTAAHPGRAEVLVASAAGLPSASQSWRSMRIVTQHAVVALELHP
jgi:hypothetical protein